jgi:hypothetical protein
MLVYVTICVLELLLRKEAHVTHIITGDISQMSANDKLAMQEKIADERELKKREIIALERIATALERKR